MKNLLPPLPSKVVEFENLAIELIDNDICTQDFLYSHIMWSPRISYAAREQLKRLHEDDMKFTPFAVQEGKDN